MTNRNWNAETPAGRHLPYAAHVDDHTLETRDGMLMQVLELRGLLYETADSDTLNYRKALRAATLQAIGRPDLALYQHVVRVRVSPPEHTSFPDRFSTVLDARWAGRLAARHLYANRIFITLVHRSTPARASFGLFSKTARAATRATRLRILDAAREALEATLVSYGSRLLGLRMDDGEPASEPLEFLSALFHGEEQRVALPFGDVGMHLPRRRISFGADTVELSAPGPGARRFAAIVSVKDYPGQSSVGMLDELQRLPLELTVSQSFGFIDRRESLGRMNLALRRMKASDDEAVTLRAELAVAKDEVAAGRAAFGEHHLSVAVWGDAPETCDRGVAEVLAATAELGLVAVREDIALEPTFWAQFPGNFRYIARRALISTHNFAGLASGHNFARGRARGNHWGAAVTMLETTAAGPYHFNFHQGDLGNFTVIGPSGSGKTVVLNFLLAQARRFDPQIMFFDKDRGAELFIRAIGGRYEVLSPSQRSGLNPLLLPETPANRQFLIDWVTLLVGGANHEELAQIGDAVEANFRHRDELRRLRHFAEMFRGGSRPAPGDLTSRLRRWHGEGERAWLFDNAEDRIDPGARAAGFDMTQILDDPVARTPAMMYLFHRVEQRLDGSPTIIVVDEGWKALDDDVFVRRIQDWEKTIRKRNGVVGFATQSAADALRSRIASAIIEQAATQIFMVNPKAQRSDYIDGFGLTRHEYDLVRGLPDDAHCFLVKHGLDSVLVRLDLRGEDDLLTILSGRESSVRRLDAIRARVGDDPAAWMPLLMEGAP